MSRFTPIAVALSGAGVVTGSYYFSPKYENKDVSSKIKVLFKDKYKVTLIGVDEDEI